MKHILIIVCLLPLSICPSFGQNRVLQRHLLFDIGKSALRPYEVFMLGEVVDSIRLETLTDYQIELRGNTDNTGSSSYNQKLSAERCAAVRQFLLNKGISNARFQAQAFGENTPVTENSSDAGKQLNRRVELIVVWQAKIPPSVSEAKKAEKPIIGQLPTPVAAAPVSEMRNIDDFYAKMTPQKDGQTFTINASATETMTVETAQQTRLVFPPDAFDVPINTPISIKIKEFYRIEDIIAQNLTTQTTDGRLLVSGGMVYVEAKTRDGKTLTPKKNYTLVMPRQMPTAMSPYEAAIPENSETQMQQFVVNGSNSTGGLLRWQQASRSNNTAYYDRISIIQQKRATLRSLLKRLTDTSGCYKMLVFRKYTSRYELQNGKKMRVKDSTTVYSDRRPKGYKLIGVNENDASIAPLCFEIAEWIDSARVGTTADWKNKHRRIQRAELTNIYKTFNAFTFVSSGSRLLGTQKKRKVWSYETLIARINQKLVDLNKQEIDNQKLLADYQKRLAALKLNQDSTNQADIAGSYIFETQQMGWINCDYFWNTDKKLLVDVSTNTELKENMQAILIFKRRKAVMNMNGGGKRIEFFRIPKDEEAVILVLSVKNGQPFVAMHDFVISDDKVNLEFASVTPEVLREKLKLMN
jgi:OmpA family